MKKTIKSFLILLLFFNFSFVYTQSKPNENSYRYSINLNEVINHKLPVTLMTPKIESDEIIFRMPKMIPGTYHIYDFGRFVYNFTAYDNGGNKLPVEMIDSSSWKISGAKNLAKITYNIRETWEPENKHNFVFEPAGTSYDENKSYVLNNNTLFGYFDGMLRLNCVVDITKPQNFYGSSGMTPVYSDATHDKFVYPDYHVLVDMPILYTVPDTTVLKIGDTEVLISVFSENKAVTSKFLARDIKAMMEALNSYFGGSLPVKRYAFLCYFANKSGSGSAGALEHASSSLYFLVIQDTSLLKGGTIAAASHEFLHVVTPLSLQSEEIYDFDFAYPKMSKHLWFYEGVTEYSSGIMMAKEGLMNSYEFMEWVKNKILVSGYFNDTLPFTVLSKEVLNKYENQYINVYFKGALIGMCLDLKLRSLSDGKYGVKNLMADLSKKYGAGNPFKDEELFDVITQMTYPEVRSFFKDYVEGPYPLPLKEMLELAGVKYTKSGKTRVFTLGNISIEINNEKGYVKVVKTDEMNSFGKKMGYKKGDEIVSINGKKVTASKYGEIIQELFSTSKEGDELVMEVLRTDKNGKSKTVTLRAPMVKIEKDVVNQFEFDLNASEQQLKVREGWLGKN